MKFPTLLLSAVLLGVVQSLAEMVFETEVVEATIKLDQETVDIEFPFKIVNGPVTIKGYSAGMLFEMVRIMPLNREGSTKLDWSEGESGKIIVRMNTVHFRGLIEKSIVLNLKDQKESTILTVKITAPDLIKMEPPSLKWDESGVAEEKVIKVTINHDMPISIIKAEGNNDKLFPYTLKTIREGWEYEIRMTPTDTSRTAIGLVKLTTDCEFVKFKRATVYALIRPKQKVEQKNKE